jgi:hypothetical protein
MNLQVDQGSTATLKGSVYIPEGGDIAGWVLTLEGAGLSKSSSNPSEISILDVVARTFIIFLTATDTAEARAGGVKLRAQNGAQSYVLARALLIVAS